MLPNYAPVQLPGMFDASQYQLLDFGEGRKLERFGDYVLDRPCPAAEGMRKAAPGNWQATHARYDRTEGEQGRWSVAGMTLDHRWTIKHETGTHGAVTFELKLSDFGHVGVFPEQASNWDWLAREARKQGKQSDAPTPQVLNLFAYTGGVTLAAAAAGAEVAHVDASRTTVEWARRNAGLSGLAGKPVRWIVEDTLKFVRREVRRSRRYDAIVLDPPSYGHGPKGEPWKLAEHLAPLLECCVQLLAGGPRFVLLTCHTPGFGPAELSAYLGDAVFGHCGQRIEGRPLLLAAADGRKLPCGAMARWPG